MCNVHVMYGVVIVECSNSEHVVCSVSQLSGCLSLAVSVSNNNC